MATSPPIPLLSTPEPISLDNSLLPFEDALLTLEDTYHAAGHAAGLAAGRAACASSARVFGFEQGFARFSRMASLAARCRAWVERVERGRGELETSEVEGGEMVPSEADADVADEEAAGQADELDGLEDEPEEGDRGARVRSAARPSERGHDAEQRSKPHRSAATSQTQRAAAPSGPTLSTTAAASRLPSPASPHAQQPPPPRPRSPNPADATHTPTPRARRRLSQHLSTLLALTDLRTLRTSNGDADVGDFDERMRRASAKARVVERLLGEREAGAGGRGNDGDEGEEEEQEQGTGQQEREGAWEREMETRVAGREEASMEDFGARGGRAGLGPRARGRTRGWAGMSEAGG